MTVVDESTYAQRLADPDLPARLSGLGLRGRRRGRRWSGRRPPRSTGPRTSRSSPPCADRLVAQLGDFTARRPSRLSGPTCRSDADGVLPMLDAARHRAGGRRLARPPGRSRGRSRPTTLADLGQQVWVHRLTFGTFGLHTQDWLTIAWSGALYWLGRLQFNLQPEDDGWVLSTHIPRTGPLTPESVDQAFAAARDFFATYFPEYPIRAFVCSSWLLDPALTEALPGLQPGRLPAPLAPDRRAATRRGGRLVLRLQPPRPDRARLVADGTRRCNARCSTGWAPGWAGRPSPDGCRS